MIYLSFNISTLRLRKKMVDDTNKNMFNLQPLWLGLGLGLGGLSLRLNIYIYSSVLYSHKVLMK